MKAPTNITGPDGVTVQRGEDIPAEWFKAMPDLKDHLEALPPAPEESPEPSTAAKRKYAESNVKATAKIERERGTDQ